MSKLINIAPKIEQITNDLKTITTPLNKKEKIALKKLKSSVLSLDKALSLIENKLPEASKV